MKFHIYKVALASAFLSLSCAGNAAEISVQQAKDAISAVVLPAMEENDIPGMAVGLVWGENCYIFNYGVANHATQQPVANDTLFEIGSISKTFTATLASYAEVIGKLKLTDTTADHLPELAGTEFGKVQLMHLGTHTPGGMPLQVPEDIHNRDQLLEFFREWKPAYQTGSVRTYANPSIGTLGWIAANSFGSDFTAAMTQTLFQPLDLNNTYLNVPAKKLSSYAWGYTKDNKPVRVNPGVLDDEAYGIKSTASDLLIFLKANMGMLPLDGRLQTALINTRKRYFDVGKMAQDLIWEEYAMPVDLQTLQEGNSSALILHPTPVTSTDTAEEVRSNVWVNKTGATNGFGAYVAFVPDRRFGIVLLANKNWPNPHRVEVAHKIFSSLNSRVR